MAAASWLWLPIARGRTPGIAPLWSSCRRRGARPPRFRAPASRLRCPAGRPTAAGSRFSPAPGAIEASSAGGCGGGGGGDELPATLTAESSVSASCLAWEPDGAGILFLGYGEGQLTAGRIAAAGTTSAARGRGAMEHFWTEPITAAERTQPRFTLDRTAGTMVLAREDPGHPRDLWTFSRTEGWQQRTDLHPALSNIAWAAVEERSWSSVDGRTVQGLVVHPVDGSPTAPAPLVVLIHGGPASLWPYRLAAGGNVDWTQWLAAHGYRVLLPNPRGSLGWGVPFTE